jgi:hypothetical protein
MDRKILTGLLNILFSPETCTRDRLSEAPVKAETDKLIKQAQLSPDDEKIVRAAISRKVRECQNWRQLAGYRKTHMGYVSTLTVTIEFHQPEGDSNVVNLDIEGLNVFQLSRTKQRIVEYVAGLQTLLACMNEEGFKKWLEGTADFRGNAIYGPWQVGKPWDLKLQVQQSHVEAHHIPVPLTGIQEKIELARDLSPGELFFRVLEIAMHTLGNNLKTSALKLVSPLKDLKTKVSLSPSTVASTVSKEFENFRSNFTRGANNIVSGANNIGSKAAARLTRRPSSTSIATGTPRSSPHK